MARGPLPTDGVVVKVNAVARQQELLAWLVQQRATVRSMTPVRGSLEDLFMAAAEDAAFHADTTRRSA